MLRKASIQSLFCVFVLGGLATAFESNAEPMSCPSEQAYNSSRLPHLNPSQEFDASCFTSVTDLADDALVVDVRLTKHFEEYHALGAVNLPGESVLQKSYLKNRPFYIVGEAYSRQTLGTLCGRLKEKGFTQAKVIKGGVLSLATVRKTNRPASMVESHYVDPRAMVIELFANQSRLVLLGKDVEKQSGLGGLPSNVVLNLENSDAPSQLAEAASDERYPTFVLGDEAAYREVRSWFSSRHMSNVYFVEGGVTAFRDFVRKNQQIQVAMRSVPNRYSCS